ncbi:uncharacterized protein LOC113565176 [Drosophila persimilis]|uniref:Uncharacterized protein n=1 Tax=Drosophila pseudoobscura pseudoobscura TaxID=46245 RepID=A0A6I8VFX5_DROPS|nr:uncharacterized protein LOC26533256 [Drosophila pseudoobscura]XP_026842250.1 uncharacterized protein LOC113565176 [Drosophila persimilis]
MIFLGSFFCLLSLYFGCLIIGVTGLIIGVASLTLAVCKLILHAKQEEVWMMALIFSLLYLGAKMFLLMGTMWNLAWCLIMSFIASAVCVCLILAILIVGFASSANRVQLMVWITMILLETYYLLVIISHWYNIWSGVQRVEL